MIKTKCFINNVTFTHRIDSHVNDELRSKLPHEVNKEVKQQLPNLLKQELDLSFNNYLDNHPRMTGILNEHSSKLEVSLKETANEVMTKVVNEEKYNKLSNLHFQEIDRKNDERVIKIKSEFEGDMIKIINRQNNIENNLSTLRGITLFLLVTSIGFAGYSLNESINKNDRRR